MDMYICLRLLVWISYLDKSSSPLTTRVRVRTVFDICSRGV